MRPLYIWVYPVIRFFLFLSALRMLRQWGQDPLNWLAHNRQRVDLTLEKYRIRVVVQCADLEDSPFEPLI